jgi:RHS repeat-associated protein
MEIKERTWSDSSFSYRFAFNGKESDDEVNGEGNSYDFGARIYDSRLGRWMSVDPFKEFYPGHSPYSFGLNNPIYFIDLDGNVIYDKDGNIVKIDFDAETGAITGISGTTDINLITLISETYDYSTKGKEAIIKMNSSEVEYHIAIISERVAFQYKGKYGEVGAFNSPSSDKKRIDIQIVAFDVEKTDVVTEENINDFIVQNEYGEITQMDNISSKVQKKIIKDVNERAAQSEFKAEGESLKGLSETELENYQKAQVQDKSNKKSRRANSLIYEYNNGTERLKYDDLNSNDAITAGETVAKKAVAVSFKEKTK